MDTCKAHPPPPSAALAWRRGAIPVLLAAFFGVLGGCGPEPVPETASASARGGAPGAVRVEDFTECWQVDRVAGPASPAESAVVWWEQPGDSVDLDFADEETAHWRVRASLTNASTPGTAGPRPPSAGSASVRLPCSSPAEGRRAP
jgi:hypothetical protein